MRWSFKVGRIFGIEVRLHLIFLALIAAFGVEAWLEEGIAAGVWAMGLVLLVFGFVLLHELGHSLMARRHGVRVQDITLLPIGGVARLSHIPEDPNTELRIAVCGPAVNLLIAAVLLPVFFIAVAWPGLSAWQSADPGQGLMPARVLWQLIQINGVLAVFNFVPAFPMDGGRILRALLAKFYPYVTATRVAATIGRVVVFGPMVAGFLLDSRWMMQHFWLVLIGLFVYLAGWQEEQAVRLQHEESARVEPDNILPPYV